MILVTGGAGFIGSHVVRGLIQEGADVIIYDTLQNGNVELLKKLRFPDTEPKIVLGDITDFARVFQTLKKYEVKNIIHAAAITVIPTAVENPRLAFNVNTVGTFNLLEAGRIIGLEKFVHISSASAYGDYQYIPVDEKHPLDAKDIYGATKAAADRIAMSYYRTYDLPVTIIRTTAVYGPGDLENRVVKQFVEKALKGISLDLQGGGEQRRDFTYVKDVAKALILALNSHKANGEVFNISSKPDYTIKELAAIIREFFPDTKVEVTGARGIDTRKGKFETSKAKKVLGYVNEYDLRRGVKETIKWFLDIYCPVFGIEPKNRVVLE
jgi:UDP-glucose 4-epimerase